MGGFYIGVLCLKNLPHNSFTYEGFYSLLPDAIRVKFSCELYVLVTVYRLRQECW